MLGLSQYLADLVGHKNVKEAIKATREKMLDA